MQPTITPFEILSFHFSSKCSPKIDLKPTTIASMTIVSGPDKIARLH